MKHKAVHLTSVHYPFDTRIFHRQCTSLSQAGYDVTLVVPVAGGDQLVNGIKVRALRPPKDRRERMTRTMWELYRAAVDENGDVYHFHDPELLPVGVLLKLRGKRVIYDVHEDFKGNMQGKQWIPFGLHRQAAIAVNICEATLGRACDRIIAATPTIARNFPPKRTRLVQNYPWMHELETVDAPAYETREAIAIYVGWLDDQRGMREMRRAVELASKEIPVKLILGGKVIGGGKSKFAEEEAIDCVEYLGFLSRPQVRDLIARAKIGMVTILPTANTINAQPTKMFEYMSGGLPVIASDFPVNREIIEAVDCGLLVDPRDPAAIADAILSLLKNPSRAAEMGRNGKRAVSEKYNWEREAQSLLGVYKELLPAQTANAEIPSGRIVSERKKL